MIAIAIIVLAIFVNHSQSNGNGNVADESICIPQATAKADSTTTPSILTTNTYEEAVTAPKNESEHPPKGKKITEEQERLQAKYVYPTPGQAKLPDGYIVTFKTPKDGHQVKFVVDHDRYICNPDGTYEVIKHQPVFEDKFEEQMIGLALPGGTFIPFVLLNHTEQELNDMLAREVVINPDDSDEVKEKKQAVAEMKKIVAQYLADGGTFEEFVKEMHKYSKEERKLRTKGLVRIEDLIENGEIDAAREFLKQYNEILNENGFPAMRLPKKARALLEHESDEGIGTAEMSN